jgi:hypothetical protein
MALRLPSDEELDEVAALIAGPGVKYLALAPDQRAKVLRIAIDADIADSMVDLLNYASHISVWFEKSKLWEGRID